MNVYNKLIIVTGGGSGMGRSLVLKLLEKGTRVAAIDINQEGLEETAVLAEEKKDSLTIFKLDITDKQAVEKTLGQIIEQAGAVDGIINNAGIIQPFKKLNDIDYDVVERVLNVNLWGTIYLTKTLLTHLLKRPEAHVVNVSSMGGFFAFPGQTIYGASKAAVKIMTEGLIQELSSTSVYVSVVFPGAVNTNIMANSGLEINVEQQEAAKQSSRLLSAERAAEIIINGIEKNKKRIFVGKDARIMDYLYRLSPNRAVKFISKKMGDH
ncbi:SDR family NAD(P)-dependent oxidoreductase [Maribellus maritimus]|uniref:SDR family NAD(P)-dependent oxidoreductase n=1 Tax=Maribellus maritimus TaxID=2870838 RepID=UPI001EECC947|nr:SDR family oxidoreductase [Maribellus maritimus]MCG6190361.1 SDR family oxidoreductase [Maribellus maritimus]